MQGSTSVREQPASALSAAKASPRQAAGANGARLGDAGGLVRDSRQPWSTGGAGSWSVPAGVHEVLRAPGQSLDATTRTVMESRLGHDFSRVRVHADARAAESARSLQARAYTVGSDVVFGPDRYQPHSQTGQHLLAHELTHVLQQGAREWDGRELEVDPALDGQEHAARDVAAGVSPAHLVPIGTATPRIQRQPQPTPQAAPAPQAGPTFSVDRTTYGNLLSRAIGRISGSLVEANTLAGEMRPILEAMAANVTWRDERGTDHGGGVTRVPLAGEPPVSVNLRLFLDDKVDPPDAGRFVHTGATDGQIFIRIRKNDNVDELMTTLFHEGLHMMQWIIESSGASRLGAPDPAATRALTLTRFATQIAGIRRTIGRLADSVNARRRAAGRAEITATGLDTMAPWLMEEVLVRAETEVFRLFWQTQQGRASRRPYILMLTGQNTEVNRRMVDTYVFEFSRQFTPDDKTGLTLEERELLDMLVQMMEGSFQLQVRRRFSHLAYGGSSIPRAPIDIPLPPLVPPSFLERIEAPVGRPPF